MLDPSDLQQWLQAKRNFREAGHRILSKDTLVVSTRVPYFPLYPVLTRELVKRTAGDTEQSSLPTNDVLKAEHAHSGMTLLFLTLRLLHDSGGSLTVSA